MRPPVGSGPTAFQEKGISESKIMNSAGRQTVDETEEATDSVPATAPLAQHLP